MNGMVWMSRIVASTVGVRGRWEATEILHCEQDLQIFTKLAQLLCELIHLAILILVESGLQL